MTAEYTGKSIVAGLPGFSKTALLIFEFSRSRKRCFIIQWCQILQLHKRRWWLEFH